jgi:hypothetical protein
MKRWLIVLIVSATCTLSAQNLPEVNLEKLMDDIFPVQDEDFNYEELYEMYGQLLAHPINLNTATEEQLQALLILNSTQLFDFIKYRNEAGPLLSIYELQVIESFTETTIKLLEPFVIVEGVNSKGWNGLMQRISREKNNYLVSRLERTLESKAGYKESSSSSVKYKGGPFKWYNRFRVSAPGDFSLGITMENDAGEKLQWNANQKQYGFDFISLHAQVQNKGKLSNLIIGDYQAQFGQGLTLGGGFGMGKGSETITTLRRSNLGFIPYTSVIESAFFRGASVSYKLNKGLTWHTFYSSLWRDSRVNETADGNETISSLFLTGMHRTENEVLSRKNIREINVGSVLQYKNQNIDAGLLAHQTNFSTAINKTPTLYNQFTFQGNHNTNIGVYFNYSWRNFSFFSEASKSLNGGAAFTAGTLASLSPVFDISLLYRNFSRDYYSFYTNSVAESSIPQNEQGIYWGWKYRIARQHTASGYIDIFKFPWLKFGSYQPSSGHEWMLRYNFIPSKTVLLFAQIRQEAKARNVSGETTNYETAIGTKTNFWLNADYDISQTLSMKTRIQLTDFKLSDRQSNGFAVVQDINLNWRKFLISGRVALFQTDDYDTRIYIYERDAWLAFSIPALQGTGIRRYLLIQYKATDRLDFWLRWAATEFENRDSIGSNGEEILGNTKNDLKFQVRIKF